MVLLPATMRSAVALASPARTSSTICSIVKHGRASSPRCNRRGRRRAIRAHGGSTCTTEAADHKGFAALHESACGSFATSELCRQFASSAEKVALDGGIHVSLTETNRNDYRSDILGNGSSCSNAVATSTEIGPFLENGRHFEMDAETVGCC
jgi:hypothetical protein